MSILAGKEYPARDCGKPRPIVQVRGPDGRVRPHRLPAVPFMPMVDPAGCITDVPLHNGGANAGADEPYRIYIIARKLKIGFVPANRCPLGEGFVVKRNLPEEMRDRRPCTTTTTGKPFKEMKDGARVFPRGHFCQCILDLIAARSAAHAEVESQRKSAQETIAEIHNRNAQAQIAAQQGTTDKLTEVLGRVVDVLEGRGLAPGPEPAPAPAPAPAPTAAAKPRESKDPR